MFSYHINGVQNQMKMLVISFLKTESNQKNQLPQFGFKNRLWQFADGFSHCLIHSTVHLPTQ